MKKLEITDLYIQHKNSFIAQHNENSLLISAIKEIERDLPERVDCSEPNPIPFSTETSLKSWSYSVLTCICLCNPRTGEVAPCALYFPHLAAESQERMRKVAAQIAAVKKEPGW